MQSRKYLHHVFDSSISLTLHRLKELDQKGFRRHLLPHFIIVHKLSKHIKEELSHRLNLPSVSLCFVKQGDALVESQACFTLLLIQTQRFGKFIISCFVLLVFYVKIDPIQQFLHLLLVDCIRVILRFQGPNELFGILL